MRKSVLALVAIALSIWVADARQPTHLPKSTQKARAARPVTKNSCAQYGAGFAKIAGSDTCIKIGGSVSVDGGGSTRR
jgi:hypothetical protein